MRSHPVLSFVLAASLSLGSEGGAIARAAAPAEGTVQSGQADGFSHVEFRGPQPRAVRRAGDDLVLSFGPTSSPDISALKAAPPKYLKAVSSQTARGVAEVRLTLEPGADARVGRADGATYVNLFPATPTTPAPADQLPDRSAGGLGDPAPASGALKMHAEMQGGRLLLHFPWRAPLGAAAFRRGEAIWLVFDTHTSFDLSEAPRGFAQVGRMQAVASEHGSAIRIVARPSTQATLTAEGATWTLALGPTATDPASIEVKSDLQATPAGLKAQLAGATGVLWLADPVVGDRIAVVTALGPAKGVSTRRVLVDATLLASIQGMALEPTSPDLTVATDGDVVRIGRPNGLELSPDSATARVIATPPMSLPQPTSMPALIDFDGWSKTGPGGFLARYDQLLADASDEAAHGEGASVQARLGLARFLVGSELSFEAVGVLDLLAKASPAMLQNAEFRGLRGAARAMAGRYKDAEADFSSPLLAEDPSSALWRSYISAKLGDDAGSRQQFTSGRSALAQVSAKWKARFLRADAEAALAGGDLTAARGDLLAISTAGLDPDEAQAATLDQARLMEAGGQPGEALALYQQVSTSNYGAVAAPALLHATEIELNTGRLKPDAAVATLDSLRFRWRGDATELETVRTLGRIYLSEGRYRDALEALRSGSRNLLAVPAAAVISSDLSAAFRNLFLDGAADGLPPIQALGLFLDFKDLTPVGADGDMMVRKLSRRLVDVDLLDQAAALLKYQADNRLDGVPRAEVDTDLALIDLMGKKPEAALDAINGSRSTLLPRDLADRRRVLQARALAALGRYDDAAELLETDKTPDGVDARAEIAWTQKNWAQAGGLIEGQLGDRWKSSLPLGGLDQARLLRAAVAFSLAADDASLARLRAHYGKLAQTAPAADALRVALAGVDAGTYSAADSMRALSDAGAFEGWVAAMKVKYLNAPLGSPAKARG